MRAMNWFRAWPAKHEWVIDLAVIVIAKTLKYMLYTVAAAAMFLGPVIVAELVISLTS